MPRFNHSSALLLTRFIEAGVTSHEELANVMGNAHVETRGFSTMHEYFGYSSVKNVISSVSSAAKRNTRDEIQAAIDSRDPEKMAHILYGNRSDIGNTEPGDGWKYHGRGYFQYTGRNNYERFGEKYGYDLKNDPDLAADPEIAAQLAIAYWKDKVPEAARKDAYAAGVAINGGENNAPQRITHSAQWATLITPQLVSGIQDGSISLEQLATIGNEPERSSTKALRKGAIGERVEALQAQLKTLGYTDSHGRAIEVDRHFGPATDAAVRAFQKDQHLDVDGIVGKDTLAALQRVQDARVATLDQPEHEGYAMYVQALHLVQDLDAKQGRTPDQMSANLAGALAAQSRAEGMIRIDHLWLSEDASRAYAIQGELNSPFKQYSSVDIAQAVAQPLDESSRAWTQANQQQREAMTQAMETTQQMNAAQAMAR